MSRRDRIVLRACLALLALEALPLLAVAVAGGEPGAVGDAVLLALSPCAVIGVVGFGLVLAAALATPGPAPAGTAAEVVGPGPMARPGRPPADARRLPRLRWSLAAAGAALGAFAAAAVLDGGARAGFLAFQDSLDDGSAVWAFVSLVVQGVVADLRGACAFVVAFAALAAARRPVREQRWSHPRTAPGPAGRTTRWFPGRPPT